MCLCVMVVVDTGVGYVVCGLAIALNVKYREHAVIKMSSPILNVQLVCGCCIALTFGILNDRESKQYCLTYRPNGLLGPCVAL